MRFINLLTTSPSYVAVLYHSICDGYNRVARSPWNLGQKQKHLHAYLLLTLPAHLRSAIVPLKCPPHRLAAVAAASDDQQAMIVAHAKKGDKAEGGVRPTLWTTLHFSSEIMGGSGGRASFFLLNHIQMQT